MGTLRLPSTRLGMLKWKRAIVPVTPTRGRTPHINQSHNAYGYVTGTKLTQIATFTEEIRVPSMLNLMLIYIIVDAHED